MIFRFYVLKLANVWRRLRARSSPHVTVGPATCNVSLPRRRTPRPRMFNESMCLLYIFFLWGESLIRFFFSSSDTIWRRRKLWKSIRDIRSSKNCCAGLPTMPTIKSPRIWPSWCSRQVMRTLLCRSPDWSKYSGSSLLRWWWFVADCLFFLNSLQPR